MAIINDPLAKFKVGEFGDYSQSQSATKDDGRIDSLAKFKDGYKKPEKPLIAQPEESNVSTFKDTFMSGMRNTQSALMADQLQAGLISPDDFAAGVAENEQLNAQKEQHPDKVKLIQDVSDAEGFWETTGEVLKTPFTNPTGLAHFTVEQAGNMLPTAVGAAGGAAAGTAVAPGVGTAVGALTGMSLGTIAVETGHELLSALHKSGVNTQDPEAIKAALTPEFMDKALERGLVRGSTIAAVDLATVGASKWLMGAPGRELADNLVKAGYDVSSKEAIQKALGSGSPAVIEAAEKYNKSKSLLGRAQTAALPLGLEVAGEPAGEALAQVAVGDEVDGTEVALEALGGLGASVATTGVVAATEGGKVAYDKARGKEPAIKQPDQPAYDWKADTRPRDQLTPEQQELRTQGLIDEARQEQARIDEVQRKTSEQNKRKQEPTRAQQLQDAGQTAETTPETVAAPDATTTIDETDSKPLSAVERQKAKRKAKQEEANEQQAQTQTAEENAGETAGTEAEPVTPEPALESQAPSNDQETETVDTATVAPEAEPVAEVQEQTDQETAFTPTHEMPNGDLVQAVDGEENIYVDAEGTEWEEPDARLIKRTNVNADRSVENDNGLPEQPAASDPGQSDSGSAETETAALDIAANEAATSETNDLPEPTEAQKEAGNYKVGRVKVAGMDISIENPKGSKRKGVNREGKAWENEIKSHYGYIRGTVGRDKDHVDVFLGDKADTADRAYVIDQVDPDTGKFDEHKVMIGYDSAEAAQKAYSDNYDKNWKGFSAITEMPMTEFKSWVTDANKTKQPAAKQKATEAKGKTAKVYSAEGKELDVQYTVIDQSGLITSNNEGGAVNPNFPQNLQPRDRSGKKSQLQIKSISDNLQPERLAESSTLQDGAPIVGTDNVVESGNGRVLGIRGAYKGEKGKQYKQWLQDNADKFGLNADDIAKMDQPVLVRKRTTELDDAERVKLTVDANKSNAAAMPALELAKTDAKAINEELLSIYQPDESGNVLAASNNEFLQQFAKNMGASDAAGLTSADGRWTKQMADRVQAAVFQFAYGNDKLTGMLAQDADPDIKNIIKALNSVARNFAMNNARGAKESGHDLSGVLGDAAEVILSAKEKGRSVPDMIAQAGMFGDIPADVATIAQLFDRNKRSAKAITEFLHGIATRVEQEVNRSQMGDMFGDESQSLSDILNSVTAKDATNEQTEQTEESGRSQPETVNQSRDSGGDSRRQESGDGRGIDPAPAVDDAQGVTPLEQITLTRTIDTPEESITVELTAKALIDDFDQRLNALHNLKACLLS